MFGELKQTYEHNKYRRILNTLNPSYSCNFEVYDKGKNRA